MINYDCAGFMKYNPELHDRQGKAWTTEEIQYLIEWYDIIGIEEMSLALGRSESTVSARVKRLRTEGFMKKKGIYIKKLLRHYGQDNLIWRVYG